MLPSGFCSGSPRVPIHRPIRHPTQNDVGRKNDSNTRLKDKDKQGNVGTSHMGFNMKDIIPWVMIIKSNPARMSNATFYLRHTVSLTVMHDCTQRTAYLHVCSSSASSKPISSSSSFHLLSTVYRGQQRRNANQHANTTIIDTHSTCHQLNPNSRTNNNASPESQPILRSSESLSRWISVASGSSTSRRSSTSN
jgi:hypothetical protein